MDGFFYFSCFGMKIEKKVRFPELYVLKLSHDI